MKKIVLLLILSLSGFMYSTVHQMENLVKPSMITVKNGKLYVLHSHVYRYGKILWT